MAKIESRFPFLKNKSFNFHFNRYIRFIESRPDRGLSKEKEYNIHHILPRALGGKDKNENLIKLTYREHWIAHLILWKMGYSEMATAFWWMNQKGSQTFYAGVLSSREYEKLSQERLKKISDFESNMRWVTKDGKSHFIQKDYMDKYLRDGFVPGRVMSDHWKIANKLGARKGKLNGNFGGGKVSTAGLQSIGRAISDRNKKSLWINKDGINKFITKDKLDALLSQGWIVGRSGQKPTTLGRILIASTFMQKRKMIPFDLLMDYIDEGWRPGYSGFIGVKGRIIANVHPSRIRMI